MSLFVRRWHEEELVELARREAPREAVALVLFLKGVSLGVIAALNFATEEPETSFELDPLIAGLWAAIETRLPELEVVLFHSHTTGPAVASSGDTRFAQPGSRHLIYSLEQDALRAFEFERGGEHDRHRLRAVEIPGALAAP